MVKKLLVLAVIGLSALCIQLWLQATAHEATIKTLQNNLVLASLVNEHNVSEVNRLAREKSALVTQLADGVARSEDALERITLLEIENEILETAFLEQHRSFSEDPDVGKWMSTGMPDVVACSLWTRASACTH